jgi:SSS family transporter
MLLAQLVTPYFSALDYAVLAFYLLGMLVVGAYFAKEQHTSKDFFLAGRSMGWFPVGLSIMATLLSALSYTGNPGESYKEGLKMLVTPLAVWMCFPVLAWLVMPLFYRLELYSIYEYLEHRFHLAVRVAGSAVFVVWRLLWLGGVLYAPCKVLALAMNLDERALTILMIVLGVVATAYTFLGGLKAVIWTDVIQSLVMFTGLVLMIGGVWYYVEGPGVVWAINKELGRTSFLQDSTATSDGFFGTRWNLWGIIPHMFFAHLSFYAADQITAQRFLTTPSVRVSQRSFLLNCVSHTLMTSGLIYVGMCLLAFYQSHPENIKPQWVAQLALDSATQQPLVNPATQRPYVTRTTDFDAELETLVAAGALLEPNSGKPFTSASELRDSETGTIDIDKLAKHNPKTGEILLTQGIDDVMPRFFVRHLPMGLAGLILAALLAASMSSIDSGLNSIATLFVADFYRRLGWGKRSIARWRGKSYDALDDTDELWLGRWLVLGIGLAATCFSLIVSRLGNIFDIMINVCNTFGAPLLAVFLLGMLTRRTNAVGAIVALFLGMPFTIWLAFAKSWNLWPFAWKLDAIWAVTFGVLGTMLIGYVVSFVAGRPKTEREITGLVVGRGKLGVRYQPPEVATDEGDGRWA